ncbi:MAG TPA: hypothetical protein VH702_12230 [Vicinamibacterales bacterium]
MKDRAKSGQKSAVFVALRLHWELEGPMDDPNAPFDNLESARQYVALLCEALEEARRGVEWDVTLAQDEGAARRVEALQLVNYKLHRLKYHLDNSRKLLNDLRTLRRLLLGERFVEQSPEPQSEPVRSA